MIAAIIFSMSTVAACQFGLYYWRAMISKVAAQPVSAQVRVALGIAPAGMKAQRFRATFALLDMSPDLRGSSNRFRAIRAYYAVIETLGRFVPSVAKWSENEMATCSRYAAVLLGQRLESNIAYASEMSGV